MACLFEEGRMMLFISFLIRVSIYINKLTDMQTENRLRVREKLSSLLSEVKAMKR